MMLDGSAIIPRGIESVGHCTQAKRQSFFATQTLRDEHGGLGQVERFLSAYANLFPDQLGETLDNILTKQGLVLDKELAAG